MVKLFRRDTSPRWLGALAAIAALALATPALAGHIGGPPATEVTLATNGGGPINLGVTPTDNSDGTFTYNGVWFAPGTWEFNYSFLVDDDPFISGTFTVTNLLSTATDFTLSVTLPTIAVGPPASMRGSLGSAPLSGSTATTFDLTDTNLDGSGSLQPIGSTGPGTGTPIYTALIDGGTVKLLGLNSLVVFGPGATSSQSAQGFGFEPAPSVVSTMGVVVQFNLSPGDTAVVPFEFEVIPEPGTTLLIGLGLTSLAFLRRRTS